DFLPFEVAVDQLPRQIERQGRVLELDLRPVHQDGALDAVLLVVSDVTDRIEALRAERAAREEQKVMTNLLHDSRGFQRSVDEIQSLVAAACFGGEPSETRRALHTIKGNCLVLGFVSMAERAHALEDELERDGALAASSLGALEATWNESLRRIQEHIEHARGRIDIDHGDYRQLVDQLRDRADYDHILGMVERWQLEPLGNALQQ